MTDAFRTARSYVRGHGIDVALSGSVAIWIVMAISNAVVTLPSLRAVAPVQVSLDLLLPALAAVLVCITTREPAPAISVTSSRGRPAARFGRITAVTVIAFLPAPVLTANPAVTIPRFIFLTAISLVGVRLLSGAAAWIAPAAYFVAATLVGNNRDGTFEPWAWVLSPTHSPTTSTFAMLAYLATAAWWSRQPPQHDKW